MQTRDARLKELELEEERLAAELQAVREESHKLWAEKASEATGISRGDVVEEILRPSPGRRKPGPRVFVVDKVYASATSTQFYGFRMRKDGSLGHPACPDLAEIQKDRAPRAAPGGK
jgi:hypothetical protein